MNLAWVAVGVGSQGRSRLPATGGHFSLVKHRLLGLRMNTRISCSSCDTCGEVKEPAAP